jgi:hypothetical protein
MRSSGCEGLSVGQAARPDIAAAKQPQRAYPAAARGEEREVDQLWIWITGHSNSLTGADAIVRSPAEA